MLQNLLRGLLGCQTALALPYEEQQAANRRHNCHGQLRLMIMDDLPISPCRQIPHRQLTSTKSLCFVLGCCLQPDATHRVSKKSCCYTGLQYISVRACCKLHNANAWTGLSSSLIASIVCSRLARRVFSHFLAL